VVVLPWCAALREWGARDGQFYPKGSRSYAQSREWRLGRRPDRLLHGPSFAQECLSPLPQLRLVLVVVLSIAAASSGQVVQAR
jgi:hypothetical protein